MGLRNGNQVIFKATNIVAHELDIILDLILSKTTSNTIAGSNVTAKKSIDCDVSNIIHKFSYQHSFVYSPSLVRDVAMFLKRLAKDTGYVVNPVLDGDV